MHEGNQCGCAESDKTSMHVMVVVIVPSFGLVDFGLWFVFLDKLLGCELVNMVGSEGR